MTTYPVGSLVTARNREWVVLPESDNEFVILQPVSGADREIAGVLTSLEAVKPAQFPLPNLATSGGIEDWRLLRDAVRFGFRTSIGPFRALARIGVTPRAYQLVPLMMALKLDPVRLLIADDVGIGKTVEALLIARELIDQGQVKRLAVLCSPSLAEQWQREMRDKFHIDAELVLTSTASDLERRCTFGESLFERFPFVIVSTDFIKADRRRDEFLDQAPELIIVDEAHDCAGVGGSRGMTQRYELLSGLASDPLRHLLLLTATPHSGKGQAFRNLLALLDEQFADLPDDLGGPQNERIRRQLAKHFVQRRRVDIDGQLQKYAGEVTPFPERFIAEETYQLSPEYRAFLNRVLRYARETVTDADGKRRARIRWWSILGLLRSLASSPAAASATLRNRAVSIEATTAEEADEIGRNAVLDLAGSEMLEGIDVVPGSNTSDLVVGDEKTKRLMRSLATEADQLAGRSTDAKLDGLIKIVKSLLADGHNPIIFCRFIPTAEYLSIQLRKALGRKIAIEAITGTLPPAEREERINELGSRSGQRVLVATDCLSEGVNLQDAFDAVLHYDLAWNPTRHEQREGRVDRYGQASPTVKAITYYGQDNGIDRIVLDVLLRKHAAIRKATGVSVPVPGDSDGIVEAIMEGLLLGSDFLAEQLSFEGFNDERRTGLHLEWEKAGEREKESRHMFAQHSIKAEEVQREVERVRHGLGTEDELRSFICIAVRLLGGAASEESGALAIDLVDAPSDLRSIAPKRLEAFSAKTSLPIRDNQLHLTRTHPFVEALAAKVLDAALSPTDESRVERSGSSGSGQVDSPTTVFLVRHRVLLTTTEAGQSLPSLIESCEFLAVDNLENDPNWTSGADVESLLDSNSLLPVPEGYGQKILQHSIDHLPVVRERLDERTEAVAANLLSDHLRVREASKRTGVRYKADAASTADILGMYALIPEGRS